MINPVIDELSKELDSLKEQIKTQEEIIASGIFITEEERLDAKVILENLEKKANEVSWKLTKEIMP